MARKQTLRQAVSAVVADRIRLRCGLTGCPEGGWSETRQALERLEDELPAREDRAYAIQEFVVAVYQIDHAGRYEVRPEILSA